MKRDIDIINEAYSKVRKQSRLTEGSDPDFHGDYEMNQRMRSGMNNPDLEEETVAEEIEEQYADMDADMWSRVCEILYNRAASR